MNVMLVTEPITYDSFAGSYSQDNQISRGSVYDVSDEEKMKLSMLKVLKKFGFSERWLETLWRREKPKPIEPMFTLKELKNSKTVEKATKAYENALEEYRAHNEKILKFEKLHEKIVNLNGEDEIKLDDFREFDSIIGEAFHDSILYQEENLPQVYFYTVN